MDLNHLMSTSYPRDLVGYGRNAPHPHWPGQARIAVQFVVNYEEGGENCILHGDAASEAFLSEIVGAAPWPGQRHMNMESIYEYGSRAGFWRIWRLFTRRGLPLTVYGVATALARNPEAVAAMQEAGWEIASHGLKWIEYKDFSRRGRSAHTSPRRSACTRRPPASARSAGITGRCSEHHRTGDGGGWLPLLVDSYADDLPYWIEGPHGPHLVVPYTLEANDMRYASHGFNAATSSSHYLRDSFDVLYAEGARGAEDDVDRPALPPDRPAGQDLRR
jgi:peptidoglycan/xylan/chitin deacetylase (PgdA/CDA1 family)